MHGTIIWHEVDETYVDGWEEGQRAFTYTPLKAAALVFADDNAARKAVSDTIELYENRVPHILVPATLTAVQAVQGTVFRLSPQQRLEVMHKFCCLCGAVAGKCDCAKGSNGKTPG